MVERPLLKFQILNEDAKLPQYAHEDDAGFDLYATEEVLLKPGGRHIFKLGIASQIPHGWFVSLRDRSGLAAKQGLHILAGVVDSGYRGEWGAVVVNLGEDAVSIKKGDRVAQGILQPVAHAKIEQAAQLSETERGKGGFGSTGRK